MLGFVPQTPLASPYSPSQDRRRSCYQDPRRGTSRETRLGTVAPQPMQYILCGSNPSVLDGRVG
ncbi:hypothetical protein [Nostoc sp.]